MDNTLVETLLDMLGDDRHNAALKLLDNNGITQLFGRAVIDMSKHQLYLALRSHQTINSLSRGRRNANI